MRENPASILFETINGFHRTAAIKSAIDLDLVTALSEGCTSVPALARRCRGSHRGIKILCDYLTSLGFLAKTGSEYHATAVSLMFLSRTSRAYIGDVVEFLASPAMMAQFQDLTSVIREGRLAGGKDGTVPSHPLWRQFAKAMGCVMSPVAERVARILGAHRAVEPWNVLDMAAGHGLFGIAIARLNRNARVVALDWPEVLDVAVQNAEAAGLNGRYEILGGDARSIELTSHYDLVLLTNFLHHFSAATCAEILGKVHRALRPGGRAALLEYVTDEEEEHLEPAAAACALTMLGITPEGNVYTRREYEDWLRSAGFSTVVWDVAEPSDQLVIIAGKA